MSDEQRLAALEARINQLEVKVSQLGGEASEDSAAQTQLDSPQEEAPRPATFMPKPASRSLAPGIGFLKTANVLGLAGAMAMVLAASYLIRLAVDSGWLTPERQLFAAILMGIALIISGLVLRPASARYASLLPAGGIAVLFLSVYGAHIFYGLIGLTPALASLIVISAVSLWLCSLFKNTLFALFAVGGSYAAPFLIQGGSFSIDEVFGYYLAWNILFGTFSVLTRSRAVYLLALYFSLIGFDLIYQIQSFADWQMLLGFQFVQFVLFMGFTAWFSIRHASPLTREEAWVHAPPLFLFYALQYAVVDRNLPHLAPWIALASLALLAVVYWVSQKGLKKPLPGGRWLLTAYAAIVLFHAGYLESVASGLKPWVGVILLALVVGLSMLRTAAKGVVPGPMWLALGLILLGNYAQIVFGLDLDEVPGSNILVVLYPALIYLGYYLMTRDETQNRFADVVLLAGHASAMTAPAHIFANEFLVSACWGLLAVASIFFALQFRLRFLGQSALMIFVLFGAKVLMHDIADAGPVVRIGSLLALGISLYVGGWLYRKIQALDA